MSSATRLVNEEQLKPPPQSHRLAPKTMQPSGTVIDGVTNSVMRAHEAALSRHSSKTKHHYISMDDITAIVPEPIAVDETEPEKVDKESIELLE